MTPPCGITKYERSASCSSPSTASSGAIEADLTLPEVGVDTGTYEMELLAAEDGQAEGDPLIATDLEIVDPARPDRRGRSQAAGRAELTRRHVR